MAVIECEPCGGIGSIGGLVVGDSVVDERCAECRGVGLVRSCDLCGQAGIEAGRLCARCRKAWSATVDEHVDQDSALVAEQDERQSFAEYRHGRSLR